MESICEFMPPKQYDFTVNTVNFVYETEHKTLKQPFCPLLYRLSVVTEGSAVIKYDNFGSYELSKGSLFFFFPGCHCTIEGDDKFMYIYISYMGNSVDVLMDELGISVENPVFQSISTLLDFWTHSVRRVNPLNANLLTESVLLYTLSFFEKGETTVEAKSESGQFSSIVDYINNNFADSALSLKKVAKIFSYSEKYLSHLFKKNKSINFSVYLNNLRIQKATELLADRSISLAEVAERVGFSDPLYFSKVFKMRMGKTPSEYRKKGE